MKIQGSTAMIKDMGSYSKTRQNGAECSAAKEANYVLGEMWDLFSWDNIQDKRQKLQDTCS